jgi:EmrB/QacA subfamily drug resistance transporter
MTNQPRSAILVLMVGAFVAVLNQTLVSPALPSIMVETGVDAATVQWLMSGFTLVNAIVIALSAFLMDRFSIKRLFIAILAIFAAGSLLLGWGANFAMLLAGRVLQAICAGVMMPMAMTVLLLNSPKEKRGSAMGLYNLIIMFAPAFGPVVSGVLTDRVGWHIMFFMMGVFSVAVIIIAAIVIKGTGETKPVSLDKLSVTLSSIGLFCLLYSFSLLSSTATLPVGVVLLVVGGVMVFVFARRQLKLKQPFLDIRILTNKRFATGMVVSILIVGSLAASGIILPIYVQTLRGFSATVIGTIMMPGALAGAACGYFSGRLYDRFGVRNVAIIGATMVALGSLGMALLGSETPMAFVVSSYSLTMVGVMLVNTPLNTWAISTLPDGILHHGNAVSNTLRQAAASFVIALMVSVMSLVSALFTGEGETGIQMAGVQATYVLAAAIGLATLVVVIVRVKSDKRGIVAEEGASFELDIAMRSDPYTASFKDTLEQVIDKFIEYRTSGLPVVDDERHVVGFISDGDVLRAMAKHDVRFSVELYPVFFADTECFAAKVKNLLEMNVMEMATKRVISVPRDTPLVDVCRQFAEHRLNKLPVTQDGILVGTISRGDIMRVLMRQLPLEGGLRPADI